MVREPDNNGTGQGHKGINSALIESVRGNIYSTIFVITIKLYVKTIK